MFNFLPDATLRLLPAAAGAGEAVGIFPDVIDKATMIDDNAKPTPAKTLTAADDSPADALNGARWYHQVNAGRMFHRCALLTRLMLLR